MSAIDKKKPLSVDDGQIRQRLIAQGDSRTGIIYETSDFRFDYSRGDTNSDPGVFHVEILILNIAAAQSEAIAWLRTTGLK